MANIRHWIARSVPRLSLLALATVAMLAMLAQPASAAVVQHDTFHNKKGTLLMRTHKRLVLLGSLLLAASLLITFTPAAFAAPTSPASASATASGPSALTSLRMAMMARVVHVSVTTSVGAAPRDSAGDPCATIQRQENGTDIFGIVLYWFKMQTSWCWDYRTVTSHTTHIYWAVTGPGAAFGWAYISNSGIHFHCFVAGGSTRQCSGNHEDATANFLNLNTLQVCLPHISEDEDYRGRYQTSGYPC